MAMKKARIITIKDLTGQNCWALQTFDNEKQIWVLVSGNELIEHWKEPDYKLINPIIVNRILDLLKQGYEITDERTDKVAKIL